MNKFTTSISSTFSKLSFKSLFRPLSTQTLANQSVNSATPTLESLNPIDQTELENLGLTSTLNERHRVLLKRDPLLRLLVNLIMRNGEKAKAESIVFKAMFILRSHCNQAPYPIIEKAIESSSPLMKTKTNKVGTKVTVIPHAIGQRKRYRIGINWILQAAKNRRNETFSHKLANEFIAILNGQSSVLNKKLEVHKLVLANRSNALMNR